MTILSRRLRLLTFVIAGLAHSDAARPTRLVTSVASAEGITARNGTSRPAPALWGSVGVHW